MTAAAPLVLQEVLRIARDARASDVHISVGLPFALRIDGILEHIGNTPVTPGQISEIVTHCFTGSAITCLDADGDATVTHRDQQSRFTRVHAFKSGENYALALRLLAQGVPSLESLCLPASVSQLILRTHGLIIVSGPTGSGKSTALAAMVDHLNRTLAKHIITIEDPIEYRHEPIQCRVTQREIGRDTPSFLAALLGALRSDPDVLLVGEMRDRETMQAALTAAETGHLVLCTMHTGSAPESVDRIVGSFDGAAQIEVRTRLAECLAAVVSLRLVPRAKTSGRLAAVEMLIANDAVRVAIRDAKTHHLRNIIATGKSCGMQTLEAHLSELLRRGEVSYTGARLATDRPDELRAPEAAS